MTRDGKEIPYDHSSEASKSGLMQAASSLYTGQTWRACGLYDSPEKVVRTFTAGMAPLAPIYFRKPLLKCGNDKFGYLHIKARHSGELQTIASYVGGDWRTFTDFLISESLRYPSMVCPVDGNKLVYVGYVQIKDSKGQIKGTYYPRIPVGANNNNIITIVPQKVKKCNNASD